MAVAWAGVEVFSFGRSCLSTSLDDGIVRCGRKFGRLCAVTDGRTDTPTHRHAEYGRSLNEVAVPVPPPNGTGGFVQENGMYRPLAPIVQNIIVIIIIVIMFLHLESDIRHWVPSARALSCVRVTVYASDSVWLSDATRAYLGVDMSEYDGQRCQNVAQIQEDLIKMQLFQ